MTRDTRDKSNVQEVVVDNRGVLTIAGYRMLREMELRLAELEARVAVLETYHP